MVFDLAYTNFSLIIQCYKTLYHTRSVPANPCNPSPCGPCSQCRAENDLAICSCLSRCEGHPPTCRAECTVNEECSVLLACINQKCVSPCPGICSQNSQCRVVNHSPICACNPGFMGDPLTRCFPNPSKFRGKLLHPVF